MPVLSTVLSCPCPCPCCRQLAAATAARVAVGPPASGPTPRTRAPATRGAASVSPGPAHSACGVGSPCMVVAARGVPPPLGSAASLPVPVWSLQHREFYHLALLSRSILARLWLVSVLAFRCSTHSCWQPNQASAICLPSRCTNRSPVGHAPDPMLACDMILEWDVSEQSTVIV